CEEGTVRDRVAVDQEQSLCGGHVTTLTTADDSVANALSRQRRVGNASAAGAEPTRTPRLFHGPGPLGAGPLGAGARGAGSLRVAPTQRAPNGDQPPGVPRARRQPSKPD